MRYLYVLVLCAMFFPARAQKKLVIIGSSTSACYGVDLETECYVGLLKSYYNQSLPNDTVIVNLAAAGTNVYQGMPTSYTTSPYGPPYVPAPGNNITAALSNNPNVIIVNYPTNGYILLPVDSILYCLRTIRDSANVKGVPCFVTTTQPRTSADGYNTSAMKAKLAELKDSILLEFGSFAIDFYTGLINPADSSILYDLGDHIHMNATGHQQLFQRVLAKSIFLAALPAHFVQFNAQYRNNANIVTWNTDKEIDIDSYEIQRSSDGANFIKIGTLSANNTPGSNQYSFKDEQPVQGLNYYKIVIVNKNGSKQSSPIMTVRLNESKLSLMRALVRSNNQVIAELQNNEAQTVHLQLFNNLGMLVTSVSRKLEAGSTSIYMQTPELSNGVYHLKLIGARGETMVKSFIKN